MRQLQFLLIMTMGVIAIHVSAQTLTTGKGITDSTHEIGEVVITSTGTQHLLKDTPVQTEVISRKMLESYGGKSLEDILSGLTASFAFAEGDMGSQTQWFGK